MDIEHALEIAQESREGGYNSIVNEALHFLADRITNHTIVKSNRNWRIENEQLAEQIKQLTEERDTYKQALDELGITPAEAKAGVARSNAMRAERNKLKAALEKINGLTMSMFAKHSDLSNVCLKISGEALAARSDK